MFYFIFIYFLFKKNNTKIFYLELKLQQLNASATHTKLTRYLSNYLILVPKYPRFVQLFLDKLKL